MFLAAPRNSLNASIKFTVEREQNSKLPFLDLLISRNSSGNLSFAVYRKPSHTGNYLKFDSNHPLNHKRAVVKSLVDRANNLCSASELEQEIN